MYVTTPKYKPHHFVFAKRISFFDLNFLDRGRLSGQSQNGNVVASHVLYTDQLDLLLRSSRLLRKSTFSMTVNWLLSRTDGFKRQLL